MSGKQMIAEVEQKKQVATRFYIADIAEAASAAAAPAVQFTKFESIPFDVGRTVCEWISFAPTSEAKDTQNGMSVLRSALFDGEALGVFGKSQDHKGTSEDGKTTYSGLQYGSTQTFSGAEITYQNAKKINGTFGFSVYDADATGGLSYKRAGTVIAMVKFYEF